MASIGRVEKVERILTLTSELAILGLDDIRAAIATLERELVVLKTFEQLLARDPQPSPATSSPPVSAPSKEKPATSAPPAAPVRTPLPPVTTVLLQSKPVVPARTVQPQPLPPLPARVPVVPISVRREDTAPGNVANLLGLPASGEAGVMDYDPLEDEAAELSPLEAEEDEGEANEESGEADLDEFLDPDEEEEDAPETPGEPKRRRGKRRDFTELMVSVCESINEGITAPGKLEKHLNLPNLYIYRVLRDDRMKRFVLRVEQGKYGLTEAGQDMIATRHKQPTSDDLEASRAG